MELIHRLRGLQQAGEFRFSQPKPGSWNVSSSTHGSATARVAVGRFKGISDVNPHAKVSALVLSDARVDWTQVSVDAIDPCDPFGVLVAKVIERASYDQIAVLAQAGSEDDAMKLSRLGFISFQGSRDPSLMILSQSARGNWLKDQIQKGPFIRG